MDLLLLAYLLVQLLLWTPGPAIGEGAVYCVRPTDSTTDCPDSDGCQECEVLQYYFDNSHTNINQHTHVTLLFMSGIHAIGTSEDTFSALVLRMIGKDQNVTVMGICEYIKFCSLEFVSLNVTMENITVNNIVLYLNIGTPSMIKVTNCSFQNSTYFVIISDISITIMAEDCAFLDSSEFVILESISSSVILKFKNTLS